MSDNALDFLAPGVAAADLPQLAPLLAARPLLAAFSTLFHGSEAEVLLRVLVLGDLGSLTESTRWTPEALRARYLFVDPVKLETVLRRLRDNDLLVFGDEGLYRLSDTGRNACAALGMLVRFSSEDDLELGFLTAQLAGLQAVGGVTAEALAQLLAKLQDLTWHFEDAIASGSEFRILEARQRLAANARWLDRGTELLRSLLADEDAPFEQARMAQRIGLAQSRLARADAAFQRALNKIEAQRVTLGGSGISSSDVAVWLRTQARDALAALADTALGAVPDLPLMAGGHELLDRAEAVFEGERLTVTAAPLPLPETVPEAALEQEDLRLLSMFARRLGQLDQPRALHEVIAGSGFAPASYRFSLLALLADGESASPVDGPVGDFMRLPLDVTFHDALVSVQDDEIRAMSAGEVKPRAAPCAASGVSAHE